VLDALKKNIANSLTKLNKTRDPASHNSMNYVRTKILGDKKKVAIHPLLAENIDEKEEALNDFKD